MCYIVLLYHAQNYEKYYGLIVLLTEFNEKMYGYMKCWLNRYRDCAYMFKIQDENIKYNNFYKIYITVGCF